MCFPNTGLQFGVIGVHFLSKISHWLTLLKGKCLLSPPWTPHPSSGQGGRRMRTKNPEQRPILLGSSGDINSILFINWIVKNPRVYPLLLFKDFTFLMYYCFCYNLNFFLVTIHLLISEYF